jgi:hypothetical protein
MSLIGLLVFLIVCGLIWYLMANNGGGIAGLATSKGGAVFGFLLGLSGVADFLLETLPVNGTHAQMIIRAGAKVFGGLAVASIAMKLKHSSDMMVKSEAEKRIQDPALETASNVPAIQKEIDKQLTEPGPVVPAADVLNAADRKTPLMGTAIPK